MISWLTDMFTMVEENRPRSSCVPPQHDTDREASWPKLQNKRLAGRPPAPWLQGP